MLSIWQVNPGNVKLGCFIDFCTLTNPHTKVMTNGGSKHIIEVFHHHCVIFTYRTHCIAAAAAAAVVLPSY